MNATNEPESSFKVTYELYHALELRPPCTDEEITRAYRKLALKYHPDKPNGSQEKFERIKAAHDVLKDPLRRELYDKFGDSSLAFLNALSSKSNGVVRTPSFVEKMIIRIIIKPSILIFLFLFIAMLGVFVILFLNLLDKKLYYDGLRSTSWPWIFGLLWFDIGVLLVCTGALVYFSFTNISNLLVFYRESDELQNLPSPRRRFVAFITVLKTIFVNFQVFIGVLLALYCTGVLAFNMDSKGELINSVTWSSILRPLLLLLGGVAFVETAFNALLSIKYIKPNRIYSERIWTFLNKSFAPISNYAFTYYLCRWLDSPEREFSELFLVFGLVYGRIVTDSWMRCLKSKWMIDDLKEIMQSVYSPEQKLKLQKMIDDERRGLKAVTFIVVPFLVVSIALIHSHLAGSWPRSWSMTFAPVILCAISLIFVFGFCCPCLVGCMQLAYPSNSFDKFEVPPGVVVEESITIIEIVKSGYRHGFGLAPLQPRIKYRK